MKEYLKLMRLKQWIKNIFVFAAITFSMNLLNPAYFGRVLTAFLMFCLASSVVYLCNDIVDREKDKLHPVKNSRPLAAGTIQVRSAVILALLLAAVAVVYCFRLGKAFSVILLLYFVNNVLYSLYLKHMLIVDVMSIAFGFLLRVTAGAVVIGVEVSQWLMLCTLLLSLYLGFSKRRNELVTLQSQAKDYKLVLDKYSKELIDNYLSVIASCTVISYCLYAFTAKREGYFAMTSLFVIYGLFRYQYLVLNGNKAKGPEELLLSDRPLLINTLLWAVACIMILYI